MNMSTHSRQGRVKTRDATASKTIEVETTLKSQYAQMMFEEVPFLEDDAAVLLETNLHSACTGPVGTFGIAASSSWHDVYIVSLTCPRHKPEQSNVTIILTKIVAQHISIHHRSSWSGW